MVRRAILHLIDEFKLFLHAQTKRLGVASYLILFSRYDFRYLAALIRISTVVYGTEAVTCDHYADASFIKVVSLVDL